MAKVCINCGKKISYGEKKFDLVNEGVCFCEKCSPEAKKLLLGIKTMVDDNKYEEVKAAFTEELESSGYGREVRGYIKREFDVIAMDAMDDGEASSVTRIVRAGFDKCCDEITRAAEEAFGFCSPPDVIVSGDTSVASFMTKCYNVWADNSLVVGSVILVNRKEISVIQIKTTSDIWGSPLSVFGKFWQTLSVNNPEWQFEEADGGTVTIELEEESDKAAEEAAAETAEEDKPVLNAGNRIGVLGGTFDPVHLGHMALAEAAIAEAGLEKLILMPARVQPFKMGNRVTEDFHRLAMVQRAFADNPKVEVSDYEIYYTYISYTYDTLVHLAKKYPDKELWFVMGTDSFMELESWYKGTDLLKGFSFIVSVRPGFREEELENTIKKYNMKYGAGVIKVHAEMPDISATDIREAHKAGRPISHLVPEAVERYIEENGLYE